MGCPIERLTTPIEYWAWWSAIHWRPARTSEVSPLPFSSSTRTETRLDSGATPASRPSGEWSPLPTRMPATWVPWPKGSTLDSGSAGGSGWPGPSALKSTAATRVWISGWRATPESTTAIVTPAPLRALSFAVTGGSPAVWRATSIAAVTGSSTPTNSTFGLSASLATSCAGIRSAIQRDDR